MYSDVVVHPSHRAESDSQLQLNKAERTDKYMLAGQVH